MGAGCESRVLASACRASGFCCSPNRPQSAYLRGRFQLATLVFAAGIGQQKHPPPQPARCSVAARPMRTKPMVQRQAQLEAVATPTRDQIMLSSTEAEEGVQRKLARLARDVARPDRASGSLALHRRRFPSAQGPTDAPRKTEQQCSLNQQLTEQHPRQCSRPNRHFWHRKQRDPWAALSRYSTDGRFPIDNNPVENIIRPIALGRRNWLFTGSERAGKRAAAIQSLLGTAKLNGLDPAAWLRDTLEKLPTCLNSEIDSLLPLRIEPLHPSMS